MLDRVRIRRHGRLVHVWSITFRDTGVHAGAREEPFCASLGGDISPPRSEANWPACACGAAGASLVCRLTRGGRAARSAGLAARSLIAWHGLAGNPGYRLAGSTSAVWRLLWAFRNLARPDQVDLR
jgi:hypothetical protein